ncbi:MAG: hypothetical protein EXR71_20450 [Myxococcales bacterium]|nr:hypothetical protein [Myxococcales bacterium]
MQEPTESAVPGFVCHNRADHPPRHRPGGAEEHAAEQGYGHRFPQAEQLEVRERQRLIERLGARGHQRCAVHWLRQRPARGVQHLGGELGVA